MVNPCANCSDEKEREYCSSMECIATDPTVCVYCHYCEGCNMIIQYTNGDNPYKKASW